MPNKTWKGIKSALLNLCCCCYHQKTMEGLEDIKKQQEEIKIQVVSNTEDLKSCKQEAQKVTHTLKEIEQSQSDSHEQDMSRTKKFIEDTTKMHSDLEETVQTTEQLCAMSNQDTNSTIERIQKYHTIDKTIARKVENTDEKLKDANKNLQNAYEEFEQQHALLAATLLNAINIKLVQTPVTRELA